MELEPGIEGLVHVSEMSWTKKNVHPGKIVSTSQEVEVMVLDVDPHKRRISLGLKQCLDNPWESFVEKYPVGTELEGEVKNITEFGLFVGLPGDIDGMVHLSDLDWDKPGEEAIKDYKKGDMVKVQGARRRRREGAHLARHQAARRRSVRDSVAAASRRATSSPAPSRRSPTAASKSRSATACRASSARRSCRATAPSSGPTASPSARRSTPRSPTIDQDARKVTLSIKAREVDEEKQAMAEFGSSDSGASLGDILGAAINRARAKEEKPEQE